MVAKPIDEELDQVLKNVEQAKVSVKARDWLRAAQALLEVQDRVGRVFQEVERNRTQTPRADGRDRRAEKGLP